MTNSLPPSRYRAARAALRALPQVALGHLPTPVEAADRLRKALGGGPRLWVKRDDALSFAFGGNKVRKLRLVAAEAMARGADTLVTVGGLQSNHARATAAAAARLGMDCLLVLSGSTRDRPSANTLLDLRLHARVEYVDTRAARARVAEELSEDLRRAGRRPFVIPLGASTPLGALAYALAVGELTDQIPPPDVIVHATSSGGTQAGIIAGCELFGWPTRVIGVSADEPARVLLAEIDAILAGVETRLAVEPGALRQAGRIEVDDGFVGAGYGIPTPASSSAADAAARSEALFVDATYTAKALAGLAAYASGGRLHNDESVLFWHTGGQVTLFA